MRLALNDEGDEKGTGNLESRSPFRCGLRGRGTYRPPGRAVHSSAMLPGLLFFAEAREFLAEAHAGLRTDFLAGSPLSRRAGTRSSLPKPYFLVASPVSLLSEPSRHGLDTLYFCNRLGKRRQGACKSAERREKYTAPRGVNLQHPPRGAGGARCTCPGGTPADGASR